MKQLSIAAFVSCAFMAQAGNYNVVVGNGNNVQGDWNKVKGDEDQVQGNDNTQIGDWTAINGDNNYHQGNGQTIWGNNQYVVSQHPEQDFSQSSYRPNGNAYFSSGLGNSYEAPRKSYFPDQQDDENDTPYQSSQTQGNSGYKSFNLKSQNDEQSHHKIDFPTIQPDLSEIKRTNEYFQNKRQELRDMISQRMKVRKDWVNDWQNNDWKH